MLTLLAQAALSVGSAPEIIGSFYEQIQVAIYKCDSYLARGTLALPPALSPFLLIAKLQIIHIVQKWIQYNFKSPPNL